MKPCNENDLLDENFLDEVVEEQEDADNSGRHFFD